MTDISLSVGLETKKARDEALSLAKSLDEIEKIGKRLEKMKSPVRSIEEGLKESSKAANDQTKSLESLVNRYDKFTRTTNTLEKQLQGLRSDQTMLNEALEKGGKSSGAFRRALAEVEAQIKKNKDSMKAAKLEINSGAQAAIKAANERKAKAIELGKIQEKWDSLRRKALDDITKKDQRSAITRAKAEQDEINKKLEMTEKWRRLRLKAIDDITKKDVMAAKARAKAEPIERAAIRRAGSTSSTAFSNVKAIDSHSNALERNSRAAFRAASANKANNAILSDQAGFWRFALRGALLYFSSLATDRLVRTNIEMIALEQSLISVTGSTESAARSMEFLRDTAGDLGFTVLDLATGYKNLSAAAKGTALEGSAIDAIFRTITESSRTLGLSVADTEGSLRA